MDMGAGDDVGYDDAFDEMNPEEMQYVFISSGSSARSASTWKIPRNFVGY